LPDARDARERESAGGPEDALRVAKDAAGKLFLDGNVMGIFLFGSAVRGAMDEGSDIDICLVYDSPRVRRHREVKEVEGVRLDICRYPAERFARIFEGANLRGRGDTWFNASLWLGMTKGCEIIEDPHGALHRWRDAAAKWRWRADEIRPLDRLLLRDLTAADLYVREGRGLEALVHLREAASAAAVSSLMREGMVPYWDPSLLYRSLTGLRRSGELVGAFSNVNELDVADAARLRPFLGVLKSFIEGEGGRNVGVSTQFHNSQDGYWRCQYASCLLSARFSAFLLAPLILANRGVSLPPLEERMLDGGCHLDMITKLGNSARDFRDFYLSLLHLREWKPSGLKVALDALCGLGPDGMS
jgi:predicted nucleotidyltransferase